MKATKACGLLALFVASLGVASAQLSRETGAIYLEDFIPADQVIQLKVVQAAPVYYQLDGKRLLGTLVPGHNATLVAISDKAYMVRAKATHADIKGWVSPKAFQAHNGEDFVKVLKELYDRQLAVNELIEKHQVALGMTVNEVKRSLGEPDRVSSTLNQAGSTHSLEYITYQKVPQNVTRIAPNGLPFNDVVWVKVETGKATINIEKDVVVSISNTEGAPKLNAPMTIAPPPIIIF